MLIKKILFLEKYNAKFKIEISEETKYIQVFDPGSFTWYPVMVDDFLDFMNLNSKSDMLTLLDGEQFILDVSDFDYNNIEFRNSLFIDNTSKYILPYLVFYEKNKSNVIKVRNMNNVSYINFKERKYVKEYFLKNFFQLYIVLNKFHAISMDGWLVLDRQHIHCVENNKIKLKIENEFFYIDNLFLKFQKIYFNKKRYFNNDYSKLIKDVIYYINEYNKNIKIEKLIPITKHIDKASVTLTIENIDKDFYFTEEPFEIEVPYGFDSFIKSKTIIKILKGRIGNHYKVWECNIYKFEIKYNGRKEILYL